MLARASYEITWEKLPADYVLPDEPVDNLYQPALAAALTESLEINNRLPETALITTNYGICATVNQKMVIKAPDWSYIPQIYVSRSEVERSYTPQLQGAMPSIVIEFLSDTEGGEYSIKPTYPPGKWFFYEQILKVPHYAIFSLETADLEVYQLESSGQYRLCPPDQQGRYWIAQMNLFLGTWEGSRQNRTGYWLRWWDEQGNLLLWGSERSERLAAQLKAAGIEPEI
uniref:Putative restriction endonuclease domain-containing protein n=1 Tax=Cyanothece sp. (strain PCC 7425 / ATCC 29141) TaxID=395961 RepID=B8HSY3_CYAP4